MRGLIFKNKLLLLGALFGAIGGFLYYYWIGCTSGTCVITSQPVTSTMYGALMGGLLFSMFRPQNRKSDHEIPQKRERK